MVENRWENGHSKQRVIAALGRLDRLQEKGQFDALLASGAKFSESVMVLSAHRQGEALTTTTRSMGARSAVRSPLARVGDCEGDQPLVGWPTL